MANIEVFDGTRNPVYGKVLKGALQELALYQPVYCSPKDLDGLDVHSYNLIKNIESRAYNHYRRQVNLDDVLEMADKTPEIGKNNNKQKIILLEKDVFGPGLNFGFGAYTPYNGKDYTILSMARIQNINQLFDLFAHEIGHMYGAASPGRSNTEENLGSHCLNDLCVMQQKNSVKEAIEYANKRHRAGAMAYCPQCENELRGYGRKK